MRNALSKGLQILIIVLFFGVLILGIINENQKNSEVLALEEVLEEREASFLPVGGKTETAVCDSAMIENTEIDYTLRIDPGSLLQEESFVQELKETLVRNLDADDEITKDFVLYGHDCCYISICPVVSFDVAGNCLADVVQVFLFTEDMEEAGLLMLFEANGNVCYEISWVSVSSDSGTGILEGLSESSDRKFIVLVNGYQRVLLNDDNELCTIGTQAATDYFVISGDYYHALDDEMLAVSYEDIVNEDNLILLSFR